MCTSLVACSNVFLQPNKIQYLSPDQIGLDYQSFSVTTPDKLRLNAWLLNPDAITKKPAILFFHGNAENISSHIFSVVWLAKLGYPILLTDYRGYGASEGVKDLSGSISDISTAINWFITSYPEQKDIFVFSQSLGASMSISSLAGNTKIQQSINGIILESAFSNYRKMARNALSSLWLTYPLQYPLSGLITNKYRPAQEIKTINQPLLILHSKEDTIIKFEHAETLYQAANQPKTLVAIPGRHIGSAIEPLAHQAILDFIDAHSGK